MINKFRYKKPLQVNKTEDVLQVAKVCAGEEMNNVALNCNEDDDDDGTVVFSGVLSEDVKKMLNELFSELQHSRAKALPPDSLRKALADSFLDQQKFQIGFMDDAAECFENMLLRIHDHIAHKEPEDACSAPHCISHQKFAMNLVEQSVCGSCGATTDPMSFTQMVQYVSTSTLVHQLRLSISQTGRSDKFGRLLHKASNMGDARQCPASCGSVTQMCRILMNRPEIVSIGLVWNSEKPTLEHIMEVFSCIDTTLRLSDVFSTVTDGRWAESTTHNLVGVVTYYGKHYSTFFFHTKLKEWIFLDDATVRDVGPRWEQVVEKCRKGKFQPLLLLYATPNSTPVNLEYAPKINTPFYTDKTRHQQLLRRSITPSPEKPIIGNTRRAITPNPENSSMNQKPPLAKAYNDYQNLSIIQKNIDSKGTTTTDQIDGCIIQKSPEYVTRKFMENSKPQVNIHRTLSNGSSSGVESGVSIPDHLNVPRRRDSGNWSGDRNSASSASSTTMDYPYSYFVGKVPHGSLPGSPTRVKGESNNNNNNNNNNNGTFDAGYDSYSLSSNDSSNNNNMTTIQHLMKSGHLAQIPEDYSNTPLANGSQSCDVLCDEAEELLVKSRQLEAAHDLVLALALCNAAATRARAAMNAPYNNPQTLTLARMKHNTCIMRAKSLHRRMVQNQPQNKENGMEIRHTREGSSGSGRHSRQNSRDKGQHSRQSSRELLQQQEKEKAKPIKNIEIYATLPKKKDNLKTKMNTVNIEDEEYMLYSNKSPPERESRSIFSRSNKNKELKVKEKRSRSEDRNKITKGSDFSIAPEIIVLGKDTLKKDKEKEEKKDKEGKNKKQHKIRRKLLMGGLIRRKNRSMPDLTDSSANEEHQQIISVVDEGRTTPEQPSVQAGINGYLSEGHLEFSGANPNPNLERSKLMRKSFHGSAGKILTAAKVPPPPPLRTTSQLSRSKSNVSSEDDKNNGEQCQFNIYGDDSNNYHNLSDFNQSNNNEEQSSMSLPYYGNSNGNSFDDDSSFTNTSGSNMIITRADVHHGKDDSPIIIMPDDVDEVDCMPAHHHLISMLELPPYPSPSGSAIHSRQASEDFPPPPPPLDLSALEEHLPKVESQPEPNSLLAQLQNKRRQILTHENVQLPKFASSLRSTGETWLKELQAKQAALKTKKNKEANGSENGVDEINTQRYLPGDGLVVKSVKDLASKFENTEIPTIVKQPSSSKAIVQKSSTISTIAPEQVEKEIREVAMLSSAVNKVFGSNNNNQHNNVLEDSLKIRPLKKKSVSFCDEVILVSTAEEQEEDTYIPNPILERVLRTAANSAEANSIRQELISLCENNNTCNIQSSMQQNMMIQPEQQYVRRNSLDLLNNNNNNNNGPRYPTPNNDQQYCAYREEKTQQNYQQQNIQFDYNHSQMQQTPQWTPLPPHFANQDIYNRNNIQSYEYPSTTSAPGPYPAENLHVNHQYGTNGYPKQISSYQPIPQNSVMHPGYYRNSPTNNNNGHHHQLMPSRNVSNQNNYLYAPQTRPPQYQINNNNGRHSSSGFITPSPVPSSVSSCNNNNYPQEIYRNSPQTVYQRVAPPPLTSGEYYQQNNYDIQPLSNEVYQRIPPLHAEEPIYPRNTAKYVQYQSRVPSPNKLLLSKKTASFQPGTKGYAEAPQIPKAIVTPIVVNNANNSIPTDKTKCTLCKKKSVVAQNLYCKGCSVYISRYNPKT